MTYDEVFQQALSPLPCPVSQEPAGSKHDTYVVFNEVLATYVAHASNSPHRLRHTVQVHVYSKEDDGTHRALSMQAVRLLRAAGIRVYTIGPDLYEDETGYHHVPVTCEWTEKSDNDK